ncbi:short-chain dehydrogenase [Colletotrichum scovillei]|uniref:Short chain dehydrogenase family protein n=1 Tax=Colletotrichum scovillei TaxID=1209932 RepID=A0A9P7RE91_9PEZI|nr:short-chain dehydrogenase [Colletotrichum scovillei]KAF4772896.1 short-chain dehydrogenase [Colletotrichum scovillei]KAG7054421.1 putative short chain dehydrogenase family protein [Colletotrichum scovillei]KAG7073865.1 putative short chain dehydrogenase family protein [Colletotrichum scovillei]KAG7080991.1 putative short chain dehydrogenase family protein [Colletotrichum scovillei]
MSIALVTGGNAGIGEAVVRQLAKIPGFHVVIGSRNLEHGSRLAESLKTENCSVSSIQLDITSDESILKAIESIQKTHGRLDVLINNAGILLDTYPDLFSSTRDLFRKTYETNVFGTAVLSEAALPLLRQSEYPRIIFVSSQMGSLKSTLDESMPFYNVDYKAYDGSKAAVNILAANYARILKDVGGASNAVCPGLVRTKLTGWMDAGAPTSVGAERIVELAIASPGGPTGTFSNREGPLAW